MSENQFDNVFKTQEKELGLRCKFKNIVIEVEDTAYEERREEESLGESSEEFHMGCLDKEEESGKELRVLTQEIDPGRESGVGVSLST